MTNSSTSGIVPQENTILVYPSQDKAWLKFLFKAPLTLWRMGLGPLLNRRFLILAHTGRKSGLPRYTMVEYVRVNGKPVVVAAFGERAQWYKNIAADPLVTVQWAEGAQPMRARRIEDDDELMAAYEAFSANPLTQEYLASVGVEAARASITANKDRLHYLTFDPTGDPTPPPLEADLKWVTYIIAGTIAVNVVVNLLIALSGGKRRKARR